MWWSVRWQIATPPQKRAAQNFQEVSLSPDHVTIHPLADRDIFNHFKSPALGVVQANRQERSPALLRWGSVSESVIQQPRVTPQRSATDSHDSHPIAVRTTHHLASVLHTIASTPYPVGDAPVSYLTLGRNSLACWFLARVGTNHAPSDMVSSTHRLSDTFEMNVGSALGPEDPREFDDA